MTPGVKPPLHCQLSPCIETTYVSSPQVAVDRIPPGGDNGHTIVVRPKRFGGFNFTSAEVSYKTSDDGELQLAQSSDPGQGYILPLKEYEKQFSAHMVSSSANLP